MKDNYLWLEEVLGEKSLNWVHKITNTTLLKLKSHPDFNQFEKEALECFKAPGKIPYINLKGDYCYNLWTDEQNLQGLYRRCKIDEYQKDSPLWENLLDLDALSILENEKWVFAGFEVNSTQDRALVFLSPGGSDANIMREFDLESKKFVSDGLFLPLSKGYAHWVDKETIRIERNLGEDSLTTSGYARTICDLKRGEGLNQANKIFEVAPHSMSADARKLSYKNINFFLLRNQIDFYHLEEYLYVDGQSHKLDLPQKFEGMGLVENDYIIFLKEDWKQFQQGDIISLNLKTLKILKIYSLQSSESFDSLAITKNGFYALISSHVVGQLFYFQKGIEENWTYEKIPVGENGDLNYLCASDEHEDFFVNFTSFNKPSSFYYGRGNRILNCAKTAQSFFDHENIIVKQSFATSYDGTQVPYFIAHKKSLTYDGTHPTILYGYGGFEISLRPYFDNALGKSWLERGGVFVYSNIRGGGEYGPKWHQCALKENRVRSYEDFFAIANDLIAKGITSSLHLGAEGGSNGGLLMGVCYTQRPNLFKAINCGVPLLDMYRYHKLLAGASWMAEYGNPDEDIDGAYIRSISPYHNITPYSQGEIPQIFIHTSTKDDRVHPGHARKFAAKLLENNRDVYYYENTEGGHVGSANFKEAAYLHALEMSFWWGHLK